MFTVALLITAAMFAQSGRNIYNKYSDAKDVSAVYISPVMLRLMGQLPDMEMGDEHINITSIIRTMTGFYLINSENTEINNSISSDVNKNGITFCTGSLSGRHDNDLPLMAERFGSRIHFAHLRNTRYTGYKSFYESGHLYGSLDMPAIVEALMREQRRRVSEGRHDTRIPVRPDHGIRILNDLDADRYNIGYPLNGRLRGIAELDGLMVGIDRMLSRESL